MIDYLALGLTHALIALALLRILMRDELDREDPLKDVVLPEKQPNAREKRRARRTRKGGTDA